MVEPEPVAYVEPEVSAPPAEPVDPLVEPPSEPLPDYIVNPDSTSAGRPGADGSDVGFVGLPPVTSFKLDRAQETSPKRRRRGQPAPAKDDKQSRTRSAGEPGDEVEEVDWMQGLSTRLSAYSLAQDDEPPASTDDEEHEPEDDV